MDAVGRVGLRLKLFKEQAVSGDITALLFEDESEALTHPYLARMWARRGADLRIEVPGRSRKRAILGVRDAIRSRLTVVTSATKNSADFIHLLEELDKTYAPPPGAVRPPVVFVLDNGPIHTSRASRKALAERPWLQVEWLPKYAPELNEIERDWRHLKAHYLANQVVEGIDDLDRRIHAAIAEINRQRASRLLQEMQHAA